jgi:hypothetical protein
MVKSARKAAAAALLCMMALLATSCATIARWGDEGTARQVADLVNAGDAQKLATLSGLPFMVDGEVVVIASDVADFWAGIVKSGYRVEGETLDTGTAVDASSYKLFADTMEARSFFSQYVKDGGRVLDLTTAKGTHIRLLVKSEWFSWKIIGWKGPF